MLFLNFYNVIVISFFLTSTKNSIKKQSKNNSFILFIFRKIVFRKISKKLSSEKWKTSYDVNRQYKKIWEQKFSWLQMVEDGTHRAYCKWCHCIIKPKMTNLVNITNL